MSESNNISNTQDPLGQNSQESQSESSAEQILEPQMDSTEKGNSTSKHEFDASEDASVPPELVEGAEPSLAQKLQEAEQKIDDLKDELIRAQAEALNTRQRYTRQISEAHKFAIERFALEILVLKDHLEMGLQSMADLDIKDKSVQTIQEGFKLVLDSFPSIFKRFEINEIDCLGKDFDPNFHQAVAQVDSEEVQANQVAVIRQKGYKISDRLLRPALVVVAR